MKVRIATTTRSSVDRESTDIRAALAAQTPSFVCVQCGVASHALALHGSRRGDVIVPQCNRHAPRNAERLDAVLRVWLKELERRCEARNRAAHQAAKLRREVNRRLAA
jgi:hypothetical protein